MTVAKNLEKIFFPPNVVGAGGVILLSYLGWKVSDTVTFFLTLLASFSTIFLLRNRFGDENKLFAASFSPSFPVFLICVIIFNPSTELIFGCVSLFLILVIGYLIRTKWKISGHTAASTVIPITLTIIDARFLPLLAILPPVIWSRLKLKAHTPSQVIAGIILGLLVPVVMGVVFL